MGFVDDAIKRGVEEGTYQAFAEKIEEMGDCYHEPEDRCVMRPRDGCACLYARWQRLPWYRRWFTKEPKRPSLDSVSKAAIDLVVKESVSNALIAKRKRAKATERAG